MIKNSLAAERRNHVVIAVIVALLAAAVSIGCVVLSPHGDKAFGYSLRVDRWTALWVYAGVLAVMVIGLLLPRFPHRLRFVTVSLGFIVIGLWLMEYSYGSNSYVVYHSLIRHYRDPSFLAHDWYTNVSGSYNAYYFFARAMALIPPGLLPAAFFFVWLAGLVGTGWVFMLLARSVLSPRGLADLCGWLAYVGAVLSYRGDRYGMFALGDNDLLYPFLNPQTVALVLGLLGLCGLLRGRALMAGILVGLGLDLHINTGQHLIILIVALAVFSPLVPARKALIALVAVFVVGGPQIVLGVMDQLKAAAVPASEEALSFIQVSGQVRHSHHLLPSTWPARHAIEFATLIVLAAIGLGVKPKRNAFDHAHVVVTVTGLAACLLGWVFVEIVPVDLIAKSQFFRMTVIIKTIGLVYVAYLIVRVIRWVFVDGLGIHIEAHCKRASRIWTALFLLFALLAAPLFFKQTQIVENPTSKLEHWVMANTPDDAVFAVPFKRFKGFPVRVGRAVVADYKRFPFQSRDYVEWFRRVSDLTGVEHPTEFARVQDTTQNILNKGYHGLTIDDFRDLKRQYGVTHVIRHKRYPVRDLRRVYRGVQYFIYEP